MIESIICHFTDEEGNRRSMDLTPPKPPEILTNFRNDYYVVIEDLMKFIQSSDNKKFCKWNRYDTNRLSRVSDVILQIRVPSDTQFTIATQDDPLFQTFLKANVPKDIYLPIGPCNWIDLFVSFDPPIPYYELKSYTEVDMHFFLGSRSISSRTLSLLVDGGMIGHCRYHRGAKVIMKLEKWRRLYLLITLQKWWRRILPLLMWKKKIKYINIAIEGRPYGLGGFKGPGMVGIQFLKDKEKSDKIFG